MIAKLFRIYGRVQGVSYRESMRHAAAEAGVTGWVRNRKDGSVEAFVQGRAEQVARLADWCRRGPPAAKVETFAEATGTVDPSVTTFSRKETL